MPKVTKSIITITASEKNGHTNCTIRCEFKPAARSDSSMSGDQRLAMAALKAIAEEAASKGEKTEA